MGMTVGVVMGAAGAAEKKVQFAVTIAGLVGEEEDEFSLIGPGARVDFSLTKSFMISPEASLLTGHFLGAISPGCTVNYRFGKGFIGLGAMVIGAAGSPVMLKAHVGAKGRHWTVAASYHTGGWLTFVGLTAGYIF